MRKSDKQRIFVQAKKKKRIIDFLFPQKLASAEKETNITSMHKRRIDLIQKQSQPGNLLWWRWPDKRAEPFGLSLNFLVTFSFKRKSDKQIILIPAKKNKRTINFSFP